ncbi:hypothetical protein ABPG74_022115 [Tetrahymena malaccensis]
MGNNFQMISLLICSLLSWVSTGSLIAYFLFKKCSRTYAFKLVFPIFLFDFILSFNYLSPLLYLLIDSSAYLSDFTCRLQGFLKLLATNGMFFSSLIISWVLYSYFIKKNPVTYKNPIQHYSKFTFLLPTIIAIIPFITSNYGHTEPLSEIMCFLIVKKYDDESKDTTGIILKIILSFIPFIASISFELFFVIRILYDFHKKKGQKYIVNIKSLVLYPVILILLWIWIMFERFYELSTGGQSIEWLNQFDLQLGVLNGFINSIVYGFFSLNICYKEEQSNVKPQSVNESLISSKQSELYAQSLDQISVQ